MGSIVYGIGDIAPAQDRENTSVTDPRGARKYFLDSVILTTCKEAWSCSAVQ